MDKIRKKQVITAVVCGISGGFAGLLFAAGGGYTSTLYSLFCALVSAVFFAVLAMQSDFLPDYKTLSLPLVLFSGLIAATLLGSNVQAFAEHFAESRFVQSALSLFRLADRAYLVTFWGGALIAILALPLTAWVLAAFYRRVFNGVRAAFLGAKTYEWIWFGVACAVFVVLVVVMYSLSNAFHFSTYQGNRAPYNVIFSSDSNLLLTEDVYFNFSAGENDLRQPLFGLFAAPFCAVPKLIGYALFFLPNAYLYALAALQAVLLVFTVFLLGRLAEFTGVKELLFLTLCLCSYPTLLFLLIQEQYVFAVFYLVLFLWHWKGGKRSRLSLVAATGCLLTSAALFPLLAERDERGKWVNRKSVIRIVGSGVLFLILCFVSGVALNLLDRQKLHTIFGFTGDGVPFGGRVLQYLNYLALCFVAPAGTVSYSAGFPSYVLPAPDVSALGIVVLLLAILGFVLNRKKNFYRICFYWFVCSLAVLLVVGWGTAENGLVLYSLYYGWAVWGLAFGAVDGVCDRLCKKRVRIKYIVFGALLVAVLVFNCLGMADLFSFALEYYPVG